MSLNVNSPIPLYRQLADRIRAEIDDGVYIARARIPSENVLAERYSIGRPTVRQATDMLVRQGLLERRRGSGTYVLPPAPSIDLFSLAGTSAALNKSNLDAQLELVSGPVLDSSRGSNQQQRKHGEESSARLRIERRATVEGRPVLYETLWFHATLFAGLEKHSLVDRSLSALVRDEFFLEATSADQTFFVISADDIMSTQLEVDTGSPLLRVHRELHFGEHRHALHAEIICSTDRFEFSQTLFPSQIGHDVHISRPQ